MSSRPPSGQRPPEPVHPDINSSPVSSVPGMATAQYPPLSSHGLFLPPPLPRQPQPFAGVPFDPPSYRYGRRDAGMSRESVFSYPTASPKPRGSDSMANLSRQRGDTGYQPSTRPLCAQRPMGESLVSPNPCRLPFDAVRDEHPQHSLLPAPRTEAVARGETDSSRSFGYAPREDVLNTF